MTSKKVIVHWKPIGSDYAPCGVYFGAGIRCTEYSEYVSCPECQERLRAAYYQNVGTKAGMKRLVLLEEGDVVDLLACIESAYGEGMACVRPDVLRQLGVNPQTKSWLWKGAERHERETKEQRQEPDCNTEVGPRTPIQWDDDSTGP